MDIQIRQAKSEEVEKILELQSASIRTLSSQYNSKQVESIVVSQRRERLRFDEVAFVAFEGEIIGFGSLLNHTPQIGGVFVHPEFTRQGLGTKLLKAVENAAIEKKYKVLYVMSSLTAVNFYQANGYLVIRESGFWSEGKIWVPCINLKKQLIPFTKAEKWMQRITAIAVWLVIALLILSILVTNFG